MSTLEVKAIQAPTGYKLAMPTGHILQVVNYRSTAHNTATTSTSFVDTGMSATITPSSTSSKILVVANINGLYKHGADYAVSTRLLRGSTDIGVIESMNSYTGSSATGTGGASVSYLDSPNTNSAVTYKIQFASTTGGEVKINMRWNSTYTTQSTITLMEVAG
jgi:hypothetical protein